MTVNTDEMRLSLDNFFMTFTVNSSAEAESCEGNRKRSCCGLIAGYVSGWISTVVEAQLVTAEVACVGAGAPCCKFVVQCGQSERIRKSFYETKERKIHCRVFVKN
jgi:predicted hydrocarbon binding protein